MNVISELRKRIVLPDGRYKPGALSRLSEHLECSRTTIKNCVTGDDQGKLWQFSRARLSQLERIISLDIPLCAKRCGPKA